jgi:hypothetical protein
MGTVAVLGDVRLHLVRGVAQKGTSSIVGPLGESRDASSKVIAGGARMMSQAIELSLLAASDGSASVISYDGDAASWLADNREESILADHWTLKATKLPGTDDARFRLTDPMREHHSSSWLPQFPKELRRAAIRSTLDIVVINDLDIKFRNVGFPTVQNHKQRANGRTQPDSDFEQFFNALSNRCKQIRTTNRATSISPLLIISLDSSLPSFTTERQEPECFWHWLIARPELLDRTIVMLHADHLRQDGLMISEALSWERTAQDFVREFRGNVRLAPFRQLRRLIVRFGVTGALYACRRQHKWDFSLYFDPNNDDIAFTDSRREGWVLGTSSVLVASLTRTVLGEMNQNASHPDDCIDEAIACALLDGISRMQAHCHLGYGSGENIAEFIEMTEQAPFPRAVFAAHLPSTLVPQCKVSRIDVPGFRSPQWSILRQSSEFRHFRTAENIVLFGADHVLNQPPWPSTSLIASGFVGRIKMWARTSSLSFSLGDVRDLADATCESLAQDQSLFGTRPALVRQQAAQLVRRAIGVPKELRDYLRYGDLRRERALREHVSISLAEVETRFSDLAPEDDESVVAPLVRFGRLPKKDERDSRLVVLDRQEIEGFRTLRNLIRSHLELVQASRTADKTTGKASVERPLSIAVFGPPGAGKSFALKRIVESIDATLDVEILSLNVAQFSHTDQMLAAFQDINNAIADKKVPVVVFDEFDSNFDEDQLGWLKFFLAPMEDGVFRRFTVRDAIFVFSGGTSNTFSDFSRENRSRSDPQWVDFSRAKGPDFVSRLRGHVDLVGINPNDASDELFLIRRAILLRSLLCDMLDIGDHQEVVIERDLLRAFLCVPEYKHGGRSLRILLGHCVRHGIASKSFLPTISQLNMHVDGKAFLDLLE